MTVDPQPGDTDFAGIWTPTGDTYGGEAVYGNPAGKRMFYHLYMGEPSWIMGTAPNDDGATWAYFHSGVIGVWGIITGTSPAPTVADAVFCKIGTDDADGALWADASQHRFSKYGLNGGWRNVDASTSADLAPPVPFHFRAPARTGGLTYQARLQVNSHTWAVKTGLLGSDDVQTSSIEANGSGLPFSTGPDDPWETYLGEPGAKAITLQLEEG
jgi:hypothetical protein